MNKMIVGKEYQLFKDGEFITNAIYAWDENHGFVFITEDKGTKTVWTNFDRYKEA